MSNMDKPGKVSSLTGHDSEGADTHSQQPPQSLSLGTVCSTPEPLERWLPSEAGSTGAGYRASMAQVLVTNTWAIVTPSRARHPWGNSAFHSLWPLCLGEFSHHPRSEQDGISLFC